MRVTADDEAQTPNELQHAAHVAEHRGAFRPDRFATEKMALLDQSPRRFETWLDSLTFETGPANNRMTHKVSPASWNRCYEHRRRIFNWAIAQGYATANPFVKFTTRPQRNKRNTRILPEQERGLFEALPKLWRNRQRTEMYRRLVAAIDLGLREGEMLSDFAPFRATS
jgi:integrase